MIIKEYTYSQGFTIEVRQRPEGVVRAMGELHVCEITVYDLYVAEDFIATYETFNEAKYEGLILTTQ